MSDDKPTDPAGASGDGDGRGQEDRRYELTFEHGFGAWDATMKKRFGGPYVGMGPKGYRRSDERLHEDVAEALTWHGGVDASRIEISVRDGKVTLRGSVDDDEQRGLAEEAASGVLGVKEVRNEVGVDAVGEGE